MKKLKYIIATALLCAAIPVLTACGEGTSPSSYLIDGMTEEIPSITHVVGDRSCIESDIIRHADASDGNVSVSYTYSCTEHAGDDIVNYCTKLVDEYGFTYYLNFDGAKAVIVKDTDEKDKKIYLSATITDNAYCIKVSPEYKDN